jgi:hypothetical protein
MKRRVSRRRPSQRAPGATPRLRRSMGRMTEDGLGAFRAEPALKPLRPRRMRPLQRRGMAYGRRGSYKFLLRPNLQSIGEPGW